MPRSPASLGPAGRSRHETSFHPMNARHPMNTPLIPNPPEVMTEGCHGGAWEAGSGEALGLADLVRGLLWHQPGWPGLSSFSFIHPHPPLEHLLHNLIPVTQGKVANSKHWNVSAPIGPSPPGQDCVRPHGHVCAMSFVVMCPVDDAFIPECRISAWGSFLYFKLIASKLVLL